MLRQHGFATSTARTFWRHGGEKIDVVTFQSFNSYLASGVGCTTYSFGLNLGCYLNFLPPNWGFPKERPEPFRPHDYSCHFRLTVPNPLDQPEMEKRREKVKDIWYIDPDGTYLEPVVETARAEIVRVALPWFERFEDPLEVLRTLLENQEPMDGTWGVGNLNSPVRSLFTGYAACRVGQKELAQTCLRAALDSGLYDHLSKDISRKLAECSTSSR